MFCKKMKKIKLTLVSLLLLFSSSLFSQVTISSLDMASPGKIIYQAHDSVPTINVGPAGTNQTWNYLGVLNADFIDTLMFISPVDAPNYYDLPVSNLIIPVNAAGDIDYAVNSPADLTIIANTENKILFPGGAKTTLIKTNTPVEKVLEFPLEYNSTFTQNYVNFTQYFYGSVPPNYTPSVSDTKNFIFSNGTSAIHKCGMSDSLREKKIVFKSVVADAWGTITTAAGTFDALRVKETKITVDTIDAHDALLYVWFFYKAKKDSVVTYYWYANDTGVPLVTGTMDSLGAVKSVVWLASPLATLGVNEMAAASNINVFPNPAQNVISFNIDPSKASLILVYDITGRLINSSPVTADKVILNTSSFANGMYTYALIGNDKGILNRGKFSVAK